MVDGSLEFHTHISEKVIKATSMIAIRRTFQNVGKDIFLPLYKSLVRSHLEYASSVWCPYKLKYVEKIERVQRRATKLIPGMKNMSYEDRLRKLSLPTRKFRRYRGDMIQVYKLVQGIYNVTVEPIFQFWNNRYETRGNFLKLYPRTCLSEKRKNFFTLCGVKSWNELPEEVVCSPSIHSFKNRLDAFCLSKDVMYNYKACY